jgi:uncharacterized protein (TIGR02145 family)
MNRVSLTVFLIVQVVVSCFFICCNSGKEVNGNDESDIVADEVVTDIDGNTYPAVKIGNQTWTIVNLRVTRYNDGTPIPLVTDDLWNYRATPAYCFFDNTTNTADQKEWGALYNWHAVGTGKLAPAGWHVPTDTEWVILQNYLIANGYNYDGSTTGNKIAKAMAAKSNWSKTATAGACGNDLNTNNKSGFSALPCGLRGHNDGDFRSQTYYAGWWSSTVSSGILTTSNSLTRILLYNGCFLDKGDHDRSFGFSVRLVKD